MSKPPASKHYGIRCTRYTSSGFPLLMREMRASTKRSNRLGDVLLNLMIIGLIVACFTLEAPVWFKLMLLLMALYPEPKQRRSRVRR